MVTVELMQVVIVVLAQEETVEQMLEPTVELTLEVLTQAETLSQP